MTIIIAHEDGKIFVCSALRIVFVDDDLLNTRKMREYDLFDAYLLVFRVNMS